jgi:hypothetical protein
MSNRENVQTTYSIRVGRQIRTYKRLLSFTTQGGWDNFLPRNQVLDRAKGLLQESGSLKVEVDICLDSSQTLTI